MIDAAVLIPITLLIAGSAAVIYAAFASRSPEDRRTPGSRLLLLALAAALLAAPLTGSAEIYKWTDEDGTVHFTDDPALIPSRHRAKASVLVREAPSVVGGAPAPQEGPGAAPAPAGPAQAEPAGDAATLAREAEQLRAKIAAKEEHIRAVNAKTSLATNPLRNRVVSPDDQALYEKYQAELPADREQLTALEERLNALR